MRISNVATTTGTHARVSATVEWEDTPRDAAHVFIEAPAALVSGMAADANAFLAAAFVPAMEAGERRIAVDGPVCPTLRTGLLTVRDLFTYWYGSRAPGIEIEAASWALPRTGRAERTGCFLTGGVDSLATLRRNQLLFPPTHPDYVRDAILLYGINVESDDSPATFARAVEELAPVAEAADVVLIPVYTNLRRSLNADTSFFLLKYQAALLASAAHALSARISSVLVASTHDIPHLSPWGTHPLVDEHFSSSDVRIHHDSLEMSRLAKTRLVAAWEPGLQSIKVCPSNWPGTNCGTCEKCVRTMLALEAVGALARTRAFPAQALSAGSVRTIRIKDANQASFYDELIVALQAVGRTDLVHAIQDVLRRYRGETGIRGRVKRFDRLYLDGALHSLSRRVRDGVRPHRVGV
jgi:hypothetical protein